jgi:small-conductance mechanosensitive channel
MSMGWPVVALVAALLAIPASAGAQASPATEVEVTDPTAPVVIDGETLFRVRGISAYTPERRASEIAARIRDAARDPRASPAAVQVVEAEGRSSIVLGPRVILDVFDEDARVERFDRPTLARAYSIRVGEALTAYRQGRTPRALMVSTVYALGATAVLVGLLLGIRRGFRRLQGALERRHQVRPGSIRVQAVDVLPSSRVLDVLLSALRAARFLVALAVLYAYLDFVLELYPWTRHLARRLLSIVLDPLATMGTGLLDAVPGLVFIAMVALVARAALRALWLLFAGIAEGKLVIGGFDPDWAWPTYRLARVLLIAFAVVVAYPHIPGSGSEAFKGVSLVLGVMFSLGSTAAIGNIVAGYSLTYRRAFKVGDRVRIDDHVGDVVAVRLLVTHLRSPKNEEIVVPNARILREDVVNYSTLAREQGLILHTTVGIGYATPWRQVEAMLLEAARRTPGLLAEPAPFVLVRALGDVSITYEINAYSRDAQAMNRQYAALHRNILDVFNEYGVQIMTPGYEGDPPEPKVVAKERWYTAPAAGPAS